MARFLLLAFYLLLTASAYSQADAHSLPEVLTARFVEADPTDTTYSYALCTVADDGDLAVALLKGGQYQHHIRYQVDYRHMVHTGIYALDKITLSKGVKALSIGFGPGSCGADFYSAFWFRMGDEIVKGKLLTNSGGEANSEYGFASVGPDPAGRIDHLAVYYTYGENQESEEPPYEVHNIDYYTDTTIYRLEEGDLFGIDFPDKVKMRVTAPSGLRAYNKPPMPGLEAEKVEVLPYGAVITVAHRTPLQRTIQDGSRSISGAYVGYVVPGDGYELVYYVFDGYLERME